MLCIQRNVEWIEEHLRGRKSIGCNEISGWPPISTSTAPKIRSHHVNSCTPVPSSSFTEASSLHWIAVKLTIYLIFHVFRRPIWQISKCTLQVIYFIYVNFCLRESQCISSQMVWLCSGLESCYFVFSPAAVAFWCQPWRANIFILFLVLYVTAPDCWDNIFTFCAFLAFCWGRGEIPGGGGVCSRVLRGGGEWEGGRRGGGGELGNCPEIAHCHCPLLPIAPSLLHVSTEKKILVSDLLSENTHAAIVYHDTRRLPIMS